MGQIAAKAGVGVCDVWWWAAVGGPRRPFCSHPLYRQYCSKKREGRKRARCTRTRPAAFDFEIVNGPHFGVHAGARYQAWRVAIGVDLGQIVAGNAHTILRLEDVSVKIHLLSLGCVRPRVQMRRACVQSLSVRFTPVTCNA